MGESFVLKVFLRHSIFMANFSLSHKLGKYWVEQRQTDFYPVDFRVFSMF